MAEYFDAQVHIVLTGGTRTCIDVEYFDYVLQRLPPKDVSASWDRMGEALNVKDLDELFGRLPRSVSEQFIFTRVTK